MVLYQGRLDILFEIFQFSRVKYVLSCYMLIWQKHVDVDAFLVKNIWKFMQIMKLLLKVICTGYENVKRCSNDKGIRLSNLFWNW